MTERTRLIVSFAGMITGLASMLHVAIIVRGPDWYRFFGAGERMARLAERGAVAPAIITVGIAVVLGTWALYALAAAGVVDVRMPFLRAVLGIAAAVFLGRGVLGVPVVLVGANWGNAYAQELRARMVFMVLSSVICLMLGLCYTVAAIAVRSR